MVGFIDDHREKFGVEPICAVLPIAPSLYWNSRRGNAIPSAGQRGRAATRSCASTSAACGERTAKSTAFAKSGSSSGAKGRPSPAVRWRA
jgi:hypothetical protein